MTMSIKKEMDEKILADATEAVALSNYEMLLGCDRKDFKKLNAKQRREKVNGLVEDAKEHLKSDEVMEYGKWIPKEDGHTYDKNEDITLLASGKVISTYMPLEFKKLSGQYLREMRIYHERGIPVTLWCDAKSYGVYLPFIDFGDEYDDIKNMRANIIHKKADIARIKEQIKNKLVTGKKRMGAESEMKELTEIIPKIELNIKHILKARFGRSLPFFCAINGGGSMGIVLGNYETRNEEVKEKIEIMDFFVKSVVCPEVFDQKYKSWIIAPDYIHEMEEAIASVQAEATHKRNKVIHVRKLDEWDRTVLSEGFNPMNYNNLTPIKEIKAGTAIKKGVGRPKGDGKRHDTEVVKKKTIKAIEKKYNEILIEYRERLPKETIEQQNKEGVTFTTKVLTVESEKLSAIKKVSLDKEMKRELHVKRLVKDETIKAEINAAKEVEKLKKKIHRKITTFGHMWDMRHNNPEYNIRSKRENYIFRLMKGWLLVPDNESVNVQAKGEEIVNLLLSHYKTMGSNETFDTVMRWVEKECNVKPERYQKVVKPTIIKEDTGESMIGDNVAEGPWQFRK